MIVDAKENGFSNTRFYVDDGITGTRFDRPSFQAMLDDIEMGYVSTVIVKDLSRLGRDYVTVGQSGKLTNEMFMRFSGKYEAERLELKEKISAYRKRLSEVDEMQLGKEKFIAAVRKFMQMDKLTAPLLRELIDRIEVYEVTGTGKNRKQMIKIHYKFVGYLELPSLWSRHNYREETRKGVAVEYVPNAQSA